MAVDEELESANGRVLVAAALVLAGAGVVLIVAGSIADSKALLVAAAAAVSLALVPILWWRGLLINAWHAREGTAPTAPNERPT